MKEAAPRLIQRQQVAGVTMAKSSLHLYRLISGSLTLTGDCQITRIQTGTGFSTMLVMGQYLMTFHWLYYRKLLTGLRTGGMHWQIKEYVNRPGY